MWPFESKIAGQPVSINCGSQPAQFRKMRAENRVFNLSAKLLRLQSRTQSLDIHQEMANTSIAIQKWTDVLELAMLELSQEKRGLV
jgi:hypothetical protein